MSQYPNYSMNQMNTNPNMGMYQGYNQPMQNPYIDRMNQLQQYQQNLQVLPTQMPAVQQAQQSQGLIGKVVNDVSMVSPNDVPMDGNIAVFPKSDMSEIYCKQWKQDGTIQTVVYKPILEQNPQEGTNIPQMDFNALNEDVRALREDILSRLDNIEKSIAKPNGSRGKKAEASADE